MYGSRESNGKQDGIVRFQKMGEVIAERVKEIL